MVRVRFVAQVSWRGARFNPGAELEMDAQTAAAYVNVGQAVLVEDAAAATADKSARDAKPATDRPGGQVETAAAGRRERRGKRV